MEGIFISKMPLQEMHAVAGNWYIEYLVSCVFRFIMPWWDEIIVPVCGAFIDLPMYFGGSPGFAEKSHRTGGISLKDIGKIDQ